MRSLSLLLVLAIGLFTLPAQASTLADFEFDDPAQERVFRELAETLRCLVCQNESLAGSQAELAQDLRREVYDMMQQGKNKEQIINFLVTRYGDFVLYDPPLKPSTYPLWFGPFILIAIAGFFLARALLRKKRTQDKDISETDRARLDAILAQQTEKQESNK